MKTGALVLALLLATAAPVHAQEPGADRPLLGVSALLSATLNTFFLETRIEYLRLGRLGPWVSAMVGGSNVCADANDCTDLDAWGLLSGWRLGVRVPETNRTQRRRLLVRPGRGFLIYPTSSTGSPRTSILGLTPSPGTVDAAMRPCTRSGAPSAVDTVT